MNDVPVFFRVSRINYFIYCQLKPNYWLVITLPGQSNGSILARLMVKLFADLFKRNELQKRGIHIEEQVGHGTYSTVYRGRIRMPDREDEHPIALKIIDMKTAPSDFVKKFMPRELAISKLVNHVNLLSTITDFESNKKHYIVTELARYDLLQYLRLKGNLLCANQGNNNYNSRCTEGKSSTTIVLRANQWNQSLTHKPHCPSRYKM